MASVSKPVATPRPGAKFRPQSGTLCEFYWIEALARLDNDHWDKVDFLRFI